VRYLPIILLLLLFGSSSIAQIKMDTSVVEARTFKEQSLKNLKNDKQFQYDRLTEPTRSLWDRFWSWFWFQISQLMRTESGRRTVWSVLIAVGVCVLAWFIYKVMQMNKAGLFARSSNNGLDFTVGDEDIHQIDFDSAINAAIEKGNYRLAIRLLYLQSLKILSDRNIIDWKINKTNNDYVREVSDKKWQPLFSKLTYQFEYAWYGETAIEKDKFESVNQQFKQLHNQL
jgi:hypothetical protein